MTPMAEVRGRPRVWRLSALAAGQRSRQSPDFDGSCLPAFHGLAVGRSWVDGSRSFWSDSCLLCTAAWGGAPIVERRCSGSTPSRSTLGHQVRAPLRRWLYA